MMVEKFGEIVEAGESHPPCASRILWEAALWVLLELAGGEHHQCPSSCRLLHVQKQPKKSTQRPGREALSAPGCPQHPLLIKHNNIIPVGKEEMDTGLSSNIRVGQNRVNLELRGSKWIN